MNHLYKTIAIVSAIILYVGCGSQPTTTLSDASNTSGVAAETAGQDVIISFPLDSTTTLRDTIRMGRIAQGDVIEGNFTIANKSAKPLVIIEIITGCGCTTADYDPQPIAPQGQRQVKYRFDSKSRQGHQFKSIEVITSDRVVATVYLDGEVYIP